MAKFTSNVPINSRWRNNDFIGAAGSTHTFPDAFYDEFLLEWKEQLDNGNLVITETPTTGNIQVSSLTVGDITLTGTALGFPGSPTITGTSPINVVTASGTSTVSLNANYSTTSHLHDGTYQPFGTYVTSVTGTAPITASGTTAITVGIDQTAITANSATNAEVIRTYVKNSSGAAMTKGQAVYVSGADGTNVKIELSTASTEAGSSKTLGLLAQNLANNAFGYVIENGLLVGIDTSAATAGSSVWLGNTPGSLVYGAPPAEPSHSVYLGVVARSNVNNGEILVKVQNGYELDELHNVSAASPSDGDIIQYKTSSSLWTKSSIASAGIAASVHTHPYATTVHTHGTTDVTSGNFVSTVTAGTGVTVTGGTGNASTPTVAIGQAVDTASNVTFNNVTVGGDIEHASQLDFAVGGVVGASVLSSGLYLPPGKTVMFEGTTNNTSEIELTAADATADRTITLPDATGTVALTNSRFSQNSATNATATTVTTTLSPVSGLSVTFSSTYNEQVTISLHLVVDQTTAPSSSVSILGRIGVSGGEYGSTEAYFPAQSKTTLLTSHGSPKTWTQSTIAGFGATAGNTYTVRGLSQKTPNVGNYIVLASESTFFVQRVRE